MTRREMFWLPLIYLAGEESPRRAAVPVEVIKEFALEPARKGVFAVLGEDGRYYALDDVLRVLFQLARPHWMQQKRK